MNYALDKLAAQLNMNPADLRRKNLMAEGDSDQDPPNRKWGSKEVNACFEKVFAESGFATKWHTPGSKTLPDGRMHGIAIACHTDSHGSVSGTSRGATSLMQDDGTALLLIGGGRATSGTTQMAHIFAEVLGLKYEDVMLGDYANTDVTLSAGGQGGSVSRSGNGRREA